MLRAGQLDLPKELLPLVPRQIESITVPINHCYPTFRIWIGEPPPFSFGGKLALEYEGRPLFAELVILRLLQKEGWNGVWVSSFGKRFLRDMPMSWKLENAIAPAPPECEKISRIGGKLSGCFDVFAWRNGETLFCESKRSKHDRIRTTQKRWIEAALASGIAQSSLLIAEWSCE